MGVHMWHALAHVACPTSYAQEGKPLGTAHDRMPSSPALMTSAAPAHRLMTAGDTLRKATIAAYIPSALHAPVAKLLASLPPSVCSLSQEQRSRLPAAFKREFCPGGSTAAAGTAGTLGGTGTWAAAVAEQTFRSAGAAAFVSKMCG